MNLEKLKVSSWKTCLYRLIKLKRPFRSFRSQSKHLLGWLPKVAELFINTLSEQDVAKSQSEVLARRVKSCVSKFYGFVNLRVIFNNTCRIKSFFPYKDRISRSQRSKVVYRANCWDCDSFYVGKTKRRLHDRKTEHFKALSQGCHASALALPVTTSNGTILISSLLESPTYSVKLKKLFWSVSWNPHLMKMLVARSYFFINFYW